jgi:hypothetical protein
VEKLKKAAKRHASGRKAAFFCFEERNLSRICQPQKYRYNAVHIMLLFRKQSCDYTIAEKYIDYCSNSIETSA